MRCCRGCVGRKMCLGEDEAFLTFAPFLLAFLLHSSAFGPCCWQVYCRRKFSVTLENSLWQAKEDVVSQNWAVALFVNRASVNQEKEMEWHSLTGCSSSSLITLSSLSAELSKYVCHRTSWIYLSMPSPKFINLEHNNPILISFLDCLSSNTSPADKAEDL